MEVSQPFNRLCKVVLNHREVERSKFRKHCGYTPCWNPFLEDVKLRFVHLRSVVLDNICMLELSHERYFLLNIFHDCPFQLECLNRHESSSKRIHSNMNNAKGSHSNLCSECPLVTLNNPFMSMVAFCFGLGFRFWIGCLHSILNG